MVRTGWWLVALLGAGMVSEPLWVAPAAAADAPAAADVLAKVDANLVSDSRSNLVKMTQMKNGRPREFVMQVFAKGNDKAAIETLEPVREKGTRYLRLKDEMWTYMPTIERTSKISGHMLRQGLAGTDASYEDLMSMNKLREQYSAKVVATETLNGRSVWKLELTAIDATIAYPKRLIWVDAADYIPLKQEMYAVSGMLLKTWEMGDVATFGTRKYPTRMVISDKVQQGSSTTMVLSNLQFGVSIDDTTFTTGWLERK